MSVKERLRNFLHHAQAHLFDYLDAFDSNEHADLLDARICAAVKRVYYSAPPAGLRGSVNGARLHRRRAHRMAQLASQRWPRPGCPCLQRSMNVHRNHCPRCSGSLDASGSAPPFSLQSFPPVPEEGTKRTFFLCSDSTIILDGTLGHPSPLHEDEDE
ncbi:hypothetical protein WOLCODRAFT_155415 [Wolfiporia cocos MD-104 SS10]|uniref:Uncharacterized protein n=1 Tax=Wolfiporia cocos (strain MD-104) TaxID=742152 RepID=A0A2H3JAR6_WOLCO|nr:hypothetical protein WOLCODRAFT_155415 [Wolfiporia cocos MD-104 SS10]